MELAMFRTSQGRFFPQLTSPLPTGSHISIPALPVLPVASQTDGGRKEGSCCVGADRAVGRGGAVCPGWDRRAQQPSCPMNNKPRQSRAGGNMSRL